MKEFTNQNMRNKCKTENFFKIKNNMKNKK